MDKRIYTIYWWKELFNKYAIAVLNVTFTNVQQDDRKMYSLS